MIDLAPADEPETDVPEMLADLRWIMLEEPLCWDPDVGREGCRYCGVLVAGLTVAHTSACPWARTMPRIVALLEARVCACS